MGVTQDVHKGSGVMPRWCKWHAVRVRIKWQRSEAKCVGAIRHVQSEAHLVKAQHPSIEVLVFMRGFKKVGVKAPRIKGGALID